MLTDVLTIRTSNETDEEYAVVSVDGSNTTRKSRSGSLDQPKVLSIRHSASPKDTTQTDRHLVQYQDTILVGGKPRLATLNLTIALDRDIPGATSVGLDLFTRLVSLIVPTIPVDDDVNGHLGTLTSILRGEG